MHARMTLLGVAILALCTGLVMARAAGAPSPKRGRAATDAERASFAAQIAAEEGEWRRRSEESFPQDQWSQRDDFHAREGQRIRDLARDKGVPYEDVLRAIDDDIHKSGVGERRGARAVPCKPRPIYD